MFVCPECGEGGDASGACPRDGATRADQGNDSFLGLTMGSYRVTRLIGAGGMGRVYRAVQPEIGGRVAIKVLSEACALEPRFQERFFAEARAVNLIRHEKIINIVDLARLPDGRPYIVMEFLDGSPLSAVFRGRGPLPLAPLVRLMLEVLDGVGAAHDKDVVHRDLKPDNIFVSPNGHATVLDFGIAKLAEGDSAGLTQTGALLGTPKYMSPEQVMGLPADARADVYSLGVILYEGVVGAPPFAPGPTFELMRQHVEVAPTPPSMRRADVPPNLESVIMRALDKRPEARFKNAHDMRRALQATLDELPHDSLDVVGRRQTDAAEQVVSRVAPDDLATRTAPPRPLAQGDTTAGGLPKTIAPVTPPVPVPSTAAALPKKKTPVWSIVIPAVVVLAAIGAVGTVLLMRRGDTSGSSTVDVAGASPDDQAGPLKKDKQKEKPAPTADESTKLTEEQLADFDVSAWRDTATAIARKKFAPDAHLTMIYVPLELPEGRVNISGDGSVVYYFGAKSQVGSDDGCALLVAFESRGISSKRFPEILCERPPLPKEFKCTPAQVLKRAYKSELEGTKSKQGSASLFWAEPYGFRWAFTAIDGKAGYIEDDCK